VRVFISYRREDTSGQAGRLYDALAKELGQDNVFMDVDTIDIGVEFRHAIESAVTSCDVLFAMIGPRWLTVADSRGERRLSRADDYVRLEIETALSRRIKIMPLLVDDADMSVANVLELFAPPVPRPPEGVDPAARVARSAILGAGVAIGPNLFVGERVRCFQFNDDAVGH